VRGVTLEELRAFLTSVLVKPAPSRNGLGWLRFRFKDRAVLALTEAAKGDSSAASAASSSAK
jgi:hypothetical protein